MRYHRFSGASCCQIHEHLHDSPKRKASKSLGGTMYSKDHPTVKWFYGSFNSQKSSGGPTILENQWLRNLCLESGAAEARFIEVDRPAIASQKGVILEALQATKTVASLAFRFNREALRTVFHSLTSLEFRNTW